MSQIATAKVRNKTRHAKTVSGKRVNRIKMKSLKNVCRKDNENLMLWNVTQLFFPCRIVRAFYVKIFTFFS